MATDNGGWAGSRDFGVRLPCETKTCPYNSILSQECSCPSSVHLKNGQCTLYKKYKEAKRKVKRNLGSKNRS